MMEVSLNKVKQECTSCIQSYTIKYTNCEKLNGSLALASFLTMMRILNRNALNQDHSQNTHASLSFFASFSSYHFFAWRTM